MCGITGVLALRDSVTVTEPYVTRLREEVAHRGPRVGLGFRRLAWEHVEPLHGISEHEAAARVIDELRTSVRLRNVSDVPV